MSDLNLSPSVYHKHVLRNTKQKLAFVGGDFESWRDTLAGKVKALLGDWASEKCELNPQVVWKREHPLGTIEKIVFTSEPFSDVNAYLCIPKSTDGKIPCFITLQGHSTGAHNSIGLDKDTESEEIEVEGDRDFGLGCMKRGVAAFCVEQRSFGLRDERVQKMVSPHGCHDAVMHALMLGKTLAGERVYDVERALDYLETRPEIDMERIGIMGNSGGGTITMFAAAVLRNRITYAMPSCSFCTYEASIMSIYHCSDNYIPGLLKYADMPDLLGVFAPNPVVVVAGKHDDIFPLNGVREAFDKLSAIYEAAGAKEKCELVVGKEGHRFYADLAWPRMLQMI
ncbi:MAG: acetylxylan esterase [Victivallales bacterium]|nr:acetylxylan esterase [Victivallales bacterium]